MPLHPQAAAFLATWNAVNKRPLENQPLELARAHHKPIVALKTGRSAQGARVATSHTSSLAGADSLYDSLFERHGIARMKSATAFAETLKFLHHGGRRLYAVDQTDALANKIRHEVARLRVPCGGGAVDRVEGVAADDALQRHRQRAGTVGSAIPGVGPDRTQLPRGFTGSALGTDCIARGRRRGHFPRLP